MSEVQRPYTTTFTSFSGADMVVSLDGKIIGELTEVRWEKQLGVYSAGEVSGFIKAAAFDRDPLADFEDKEFDILIRFLNEFGQAKIEFIKGVRLKTKTGGASIDEFSQELEYTFEARDAVIIPNMLKTTKEQLGFVFENYNTKDRKIRMEVDAYVALMSHMFEMRYFEVVNAGELARLRRAEAELQK
jgi:ribosomal protein L7/L12